MKGKVGVINITVWNENDYKDYQSNGDFEVENFIKTEHRSKAAQWISGELGVGTHRCIIKVVDDGEISFELITFKTIR